MAEQPPSTLPADFKFENSGAPPATLPHDFKFDEDKPSVIERAWKATGLPDTYRGLVKGFGDDGDWDPGVVVHNAMKLFGAGLNESGQHTVDAMDAASKGKFLEALGQGVVSVPFAGPMIDKLATHLERGELPEAAGTAFSLFGPKIFEAGKAAAPIMAAKAAEAAPIVRAAASGALKGAAAPVPVPFTGMTLPASLVGAATGGAAELGFHIPGRGVGATVGAIAPMVRGARASIADLMAARATPVVPVEPMVTPWRNYEYAPGEAPANVTPADLMRAQAGGLRETPTTVDLRSMAEYSPEDLKMAAQGIMERRAAAKPGSPAADLTQRLNAIRDELRARDMPRDQRIGSMIEDDTPKPATPTLEDLLSSSIEQARKAKSK